jgi:putative nucleotidyltransferase with HDIG domain
VGNKTLDLPCIDPALLRPGLFVVLDLPWFDHNFLFNRFLLANEADVIALQRLCLPAIRYDPARSTSYPLRIPKPPSPASAPDPAETIRRAEKKIRIQQVRAQHDRLARSERCYANTADEARTLMPRLFWAPNQAAIEATAWIKAVDNGPLADSGVVLHLMNQNQGDEGGAGHALNVVILSRLLGRALNLSGPELDDLCLGALLHDIGKSRVSRGVLMKPEEERKAYEHDFVRQHAEYGEAIAIELGLPTSVQKIIRHHHEHHDGSGYPDGLQGSAISQLTRIVAIANRYDNLCHSQDPAKSLIPTEALAVMYRRESNRYDTALLTALIKCLGVYPPGSLVALNNGTIALVIDINEHKLLHPTVLLYDPHTPRREAHIVALAEVPELSIEKVLRPAECSSAILEYLLPNGLPAANRKPN